MRTQFKKMVFFLGFSFFIGGGCLSVEINPSETAAAREKRDSLEQKRQVDMLISSSGQAIVIEVEELNKEEIQTFQIGEWVFYQHPLPSYLPIYAVWLEDEKVVQKTLAYHAWDVNLDGEPDMFEGLDINGKPYIQLFDFNFDRQIDRIEKKDLVSTPLDVYETLKLD